MVTGPSTFGLIVDYPLLILKVLEEGTGKIPSPAYPWHVMSKVCAVATLMFTVIFTMHLNRNRGNMTHPLLLYFHLGIMGAYATIQSHYLIWCFPAAVLVGSTYADIGFKRLVRQLEFYPALLFIVILSG